jgi:hypothetical protein
MCDLLKMSPAGWPDRTMGVESHLIVCCMWDRVLDRLLYAGSHLIACCVLFAGSEFKNTTKFVFKSLRIPCRKSFTKQIRKT